VEQVLGFDVQPTVVKDPVIDVPAIDMTNTGVTSQKPHPPARKKRTRRAASGRKQPAKAKAQSKRTRDGSVGRDTFDQVEALVKAGKTKTEAFKQVAGDTGRNVGTVSANYYHVARASGAVKPRKRRSKPAASRATRARRRAAHSVRRPSSVGSGNGVNDVDQTVGQLVASVQALTEAVQAQDAEVRQLRGRLDGVRGLLS
jgi:hypothetical protein